jgi:hypothetical protein
MAKRYPRIEPQAVPPTEATKGPNKRSPWLIDPLRSPDGGGPCAMPKPFKRGTRAAIRRAFAAANPIPPHNQMRQAAGSIILIPGKISAANVPSAQATLKSKKTSNVLPNGNQSLLGRITVSLSGRPLRFSERRERTMVQRSRRNLATHHGRSKRC